MAKKGGITSKSKAVFSGENRTKCQNPAKKDLNMALAVRMLMSGKRPILNLFS